MIKTLVVFGVGFSVFTILYFLIAYYHNERMNKFNLVNGYSEESKK